MEMVMSIYVTRWGWGWDTQFIVDGDRYEF